MLSPALAVVAVGGQLIISGQIVRYHVACCGGKGVVARIQQEVNTMAEEHITFLASGRGPAQRRGAGIGPARPPGFGTAGGRHRRCRGNQRQTRYRGARDAGLRRPARPGPDPDGRHPARQRRGRPGRAGDGAPRGGAAGAQRWLLPPVEGLRASPGTGPDAATWPDCWTASRSRPATRCASTSSARAPRPSP